MRLRKGRHRRRPSSRSCRAAALGGLVLSGANLAAEAAALHKHKNLSRLREHSLRAIDTGTGSRGYRVSVANLLLTGELAKACGVSNDTIRHYERKGVIPAAVRDGSGYRRYPEETIERVRLVRRALGIGFTLDELARIFRQRASGRPPCRDVRELGAKKLADLDERIVEMLAVRDALAATLESWDDRLTTTPQGQMAYLLETVFERRNK